jgi:hypothetical protein
MDDYPDGGKEHSGHGSDPEYVPGEFILRPATWRVCWRT